MYHRFNRTCLFSFRKTAHVVPGDYDAECSVTPLPCAPNPVVKSSCQGNYCF